MSHMLKKKKIFGSQVWSTFAEQGYAELLFLSWRGVKGAAPCRPPPQPTTLHLLCSPRWCCWVALSDTRPAGSYVPSQQAGG